MIPTQSTIAYRASPAVTYRLIGAYARRFPYAWINVLQAVGLMPFFIYMLAMLFAGL